MDIYESISIGLYAAGLVFWFPLWKIVMGYSYFKKEPYLYLPFAGCILLFLVNILLTWLGHTPEYEVEIGIYEYVENNGVTVAGFAMAIAVFVVLTFREHVNVLNHPESKKFLELVFYSFLIVLLGVLPLYWIPQTDGWLTVLRNFKTIPYLYSLFILASGIILFIHILNDEYEHEIHVHNKKED